MARKFSNLTDEELYVMSRALIESSFTFNMESKYSEEQVKIHNNLLNELLEERKNRDYNGFKQER